MNITRVLNLPTNMNNKEKTLVMNLKITLSISHKIIGLL